jgi:hypothetical protein
MAKQTSNEQVEAIQDAVRKALAVTYHPDHMRHLSVEDQKRWTDVHGAVLAIAAAAGL